MEYSQREVTSACEGTERAKLRLKPRLFQKPRHVGLRRPRHGMPQGDWIFQAWEHGMLQEEVHLHPPREDRILNECRCGQRTERESKQDAWKNQFNQVQGLRLCGYGHAIL